MFLLTIQLVVVAVALAAILGIPAAWAASTLQESGRFGRSLSAAVFVAFVAALALPMVLHAAAWEATAGKFGWLPLTQTGARMVSSQQYPIQSGTNDSSQQVVSDTPIPSAPITGTSGNTIYGGLGGVFGGLVACGWIHGLFCASIVALATWYGVQRTPQSVLQQSSLEMSPGRVWWTVRLRLAFPWIAVSLLATAILATTEMTVADLYGYRTIADTFYLQYVSDPTAKSIATTCLFPLLMAGLLIYLVNSISDRSRERTDRLNQTDAAGALIEQPAKRVLVLAALVSTAIVALVIVVPFVGLIVKIGHVVEVREATRHVSWSFGRSLENLTSAPATFAAEYRWTVVLASLTAIVAVVLAWLAAAWGREHRTFRRVIDAVAILLVLIPGPIVGIAVVRFFQIGVPGFRELYNSSVIPTIIGLLFRAGPVAYWVLRTGYRGIGDEVFAAAQLETGWAARVWSVDRPLLKRSLFAATLASAVVASGDVPVMLPIIPPGVTTVGTRLFEQLHSGARYQEASLALWYVAAVVAIAIVGARSSRGLRARMQ